MPRRRKVPTPRFNLNNGYIRLIFRYGPILSYNTGEKARVDLWDKKRQRLNAQTEAQRAINKRLNNIEDVCLDIYHETKGLISKERFVELLDIRLGFVDPEPEPEEQTPLSFIRDFNQMRVDDPSAKHGTTKNLLTYENNLIEFLEQTGKILNWQNWDKSLLEDFKRWGYQNKDWSINYVSKQVTVWKQWLSDAGDLVQTNDWTKTSYRVKKTATNKPVFYEDELELIEKHPFTGTMELVRDMFLIGVWSLQRISDWKRIDKSRIRKVMGVKRVDLWQQKTGEPVAVALHPTLERLLEKYNYQLPMNPGVNFNQTFNKQIKRMAKEVGFTEPIQWFTTTGGKQRTEMVPRYTKVTSHLCRRSGATCLHLPPYNVPLSQLRLILGHSTPRTTLKYINIGNRLSAEQQQQTYQRYKLIIE